MKILCSLSFRNIFRRGCAIQRKSIPFSAYVGVVTCESYSLAHFCSCVYHLSIPGPKLNYTLISPCSQVQRTCSLSTTTALTLNLSEMELQQFDKVFSDVVENVTKDLTSPDIEQAIQHLKKVLEYNVPFGKKTRGIFVLKALKCISGAENVSEEDTRLAQILGWCVEMLQAYFLVSDDIMDQSELRRGKPCWYKQEKVGLLAVNDALSIDTCLYLLLKKYFRQKPYYADLIEIFHEVTFQTLIGQTLDLITCGQSDYDKFTYETYFAIVRQKTSYYSFYLPIALAMYMTGIADNERHQRAKEVLLEMGRLFQVQDDFLDCFGDTAITGKIGTDIEEGKCCWLVVTALELANEAQKEIIRKNYRQKDPGCRDKIKALYEELDLPAKFHVYEEECYKKIVGMIERLEGVLPTQIFYDLTNVIYKRQR